MPLSDPYDQPLTPPRRLRLQMGIADLSPDELAITPPPALLLRSNNNPTKRRKRKFEDVIRPLLVDKLDFLDERDEMGSRSVGIVGEGEAEGGEMVEEAVEIGDEIMGMEEGRVGQMEEGTDKVVKKKKRSKLRPKMTFAEKMKALHGEEDSV
ncbi:hypothetical protein GE09DRAFT_1067703 [Coniochaeta sp. 2T2.1]|nr:hypothetical protein GE09DRAFT_1067703 [Coniochaeta sp. 2T2.1]